MVIFQMFTITIARLLNLIYGYEAINLLLRITPSRLTVSILSHFGAAIGTGVRIQARPLPDAATRGADDPAGLPPRRPAAIQSRSGCGREAARRGPVSTRRLAGHCRPGRVEHRDQHDPESRRDDYEAVRRKRNAERRRM